LPAVDPVPPVVRQRGSYADALAAVAARLADGLAYLHEKGITHGDLKPSNVLLGPGGHPYLIDFNLAGAGADALPRVGGTLPYMAPERIRRLLHQPTGPAPADRGDVYAFGAVLFEALTGRVPFEPIDDPDPAAIANDLLERQLAGVPRLPKCIPPALARLVSRCLDPDPTRRPPAANLRRKLARFARRRARVARVLVAAALAVGAAAVGYEARSAEPEPAAPALMVMTPAAPQTRDELMAFGMAAVEHGGPGHVIAMGYLGEAFRLRPDGRTASLLGYAESRAGHHAAAGDYYHVAHYQFGRREAWVSNNLAYARWHPNSGHQDFKVAMEAADEAISLDSSLSAAYLNRALARYHRDVDKITWTLPDPEPCVADLRHGLAHHPDSMTLQFMAAEVLAAAGEAHHAEAVACLREAVRLGGKPSSFARDPAFKKHLAGRADYKEVCRMKESDKPAAAVDPFLVRPPR
jgi:tetratricopeptide (TPR) repeat protein